MNLLILLKSYFMEDASDLNNEYYTMNEFYTMNKWYRFYR